MNIESKRFQIALIFACALHLLIAIFLVYTPSAARPVIVEDTKNELGDNQGKENATIKQPEIVHAVSVDAVQVQQTMEKIRNERLAAKRVEEAHQAKVKQELKAAQEARLKEQQHLAKMKMEEEKIAIAHKKQLEKEQQKLKHLKEQKEKEKAALAALKLKQESMQKKHEQDQALLQKKQAEAEKLHLAALKAAEDAKKRARLAGVVDKYKAMILNSISRQWILPEHVAMGLSSKFKIRLATNGTVLDVSLLKSSGDPILDRSAKLAIYKASPLPVPHDMESFELFREISLTVRPEQIRG